MGTCTSTARHRQKQQQHNRVASKNSSFLDIKQPPPLPPLPPSAFPNNQHLYSIPRQFDLQLASTKPLFHPSDTNSLIQLYSSHPNNQNIGWMSSSTSIPSHAPARIPVLKTRLPIYHPSQTQASSSTTAGRPTHGPTTVIANNPTGMIEARSTIWHDLIGWFDLPLAYPSVIDIPAVSSFGLLRRICPMSHVSRILAFFFVVLFSSLSLFSILPRAESALIYVHSSRAILCQLNTSSWAIVWLFYISIRISIHMSRCMSFAK